MLNFAIRILEKMTQKGTIKSFREAKNIYGMPEIEGIEALSDKRIMEIYREVDDSLTEIASERNELGLLTYKLVDCIVRDRLIDEINGNYNNGYNRMKQSCIEGGFKAVFVKGRTYTGLLR